MGSTPWGPVAPLGLVAATPYPAGFPLQNGTPVIATWTAPNDGRQHRVVCYAGQHVLSATTGGQINLTFTGPDGGSPPVGIFPSGLPGGYTPSTNGPGYIVKAGTQVIVQQVAAVTVGAATLFLELWAS